jgi:hypothetical protein
VHLYFPRLADPAVAATDDKAAAAAE